MRYVAGWNLPGCMPDYDEPFVFDSEAEAQAFIEAEQAEAAECYAEVESRDPYVYWVEPAID